MARTVLAAHLRSPRTSTKRASRTPHSESSSRLGRPLLDLERARAELLHGQIMFAVNGGRDAPPLLPEAAKRLEPLDPRLARETYLGAFAAALFADRLARGGGIREVAEAILSANWTASSHRATPAFDDLLDGMAVLRPSVTPPARPCSTVLRLVPRPAHGG